MVSFIQISESEIKTIDVSESKKGIVIGENNTAPATDNSGDVAKEGEGDPQEKESFTQSTFFWLLLMCCCAPICAAFCYSAMRRRREAQMNQLGQLGRQANNRSPFMGGWDSSDEEDQQR